MGRMGINMHVRVALLTILLTLAIAVIRAPSVSSQSGTGSYEFTTRRYSPITGPVGYVFLGSASSSDSYSQSSAILTSTIRGGTQFTTMWKANRWASDNPTIESLGVEYAVRGDLILAFTVTESQKTAWSAVHPAWFAVNFTYVEIMLPPEFTGYAKSNVVPSFTNNYDLITIETRDREDFAYGPFWRRLRVYTDTYAFGRSEATFDKMDDAPDDWLAPKGPFQFSPWKTFGNITFSLVRDWQGDVPEEWYYIRVNDVTAPTIAGAYSIKFRSIYSPELGNVFFPYQNWPTVSVKGEIDPAIVTGTVRYGGWNTASYGIPVGLPGRVRAVGLAEDPYTGRPTGRPVEARCYFGASSNGRFELEGLAAGTYDVYASAAGYPEIKIASNVRLLRGQSQSMDGYLIPGAQIRGTVFSKCGTGELPWFNIGSEANIKIEIYGSLDDANSMLPGGSTSKAVTWTPFDYGANVWEGAFYYSVGGWTEPGIRTPIGVGPANTFRVDSSKSYFNFQFGHEGYYGAPADLDGHVPDLDWASSDRDGATWVSGIGPGTYYARAWLYGYVQTEPDGTTFMPVSFTIPSIELPGNVYVPFDLRRSSVVEKTVHFHDVPGTLMEDPIGWGWYDRGACGTGAIGTARFYYRYLQGELVGAGLSNYRNPAGEPVHAFEIDPVGVGNKSYTIAIRGFKEFGLWYGYGRNYGVLAGFYAVKAWMWGYVEQFSVRVGMGLCGATTYVSSHLYRGAQFNITVFSKDSQYPPADRPWSFPYMPIYVQITSEGTVLTPSTDHWILPQTMQGWSNTSSAVWPYMWNNGWMMVETNDMLGQVFGPDATIVPAKGFGWSESRQYFGPSLYHGEANGRNFRYYDGTEPYAYVYYFGSPYGQGGCAGRYPLSFESGLYDLRALTYGYVQQRPVQIYASKGGATSDMRITLTQGAQLSLMMRFKHEGMFGALPFDAHLRVRVIDDNNRVVGEYLTSDWWWQPQYEVGPAQSDSRLGYAWNLIQLAAVMNIGNVRADPPVGHRGFLRLNYVPQGTTMVNVVISGLPDLYNWVSGMSCDPCAVTGAFGYNGRGSPAPYGIDAYPTYKGGYRIQVHLVPVFDYYPGRKYNPLEVRRPALPVSWPVAPANPAGFEGMLTGELTYTAEMKPVCLNHIGPYGLRYDVVVPSMWLGGESSVVFELDSRGVSGGEVIGFSQDFSLSNSGGITVTPGGSGSNTIMVTLVSGSTGGVGLFASGLPLGASASFDLASGNPTFTSQLTITTSPSTPTGSYTITVTGIGGGLTRTTSFTLMVTTPAPGFDFSLSNSAGISVTRGGSGSNTITVTLASGTSQAVTLSASLTSIVGFSVLVSFDSSSGYPTFTTTCTVKASSSAPSGSYPVTVIGTAGGVTRTTTFTLTITTGGVMGNTRIVLDASPKPGYINKPVTISGEMHDSWGGMIVGKPVEIKTGWGFRAVVTTDSYGRFYATTDCPSKGGTYPITATFYEDQDLAGTSTTIQYEVIANILTKISMAYVGNRYFEGYLQRADTGEYLAYKPVKLTITYLYGSTWRTDTFDLQTRHDGYYNLEFLYYWRTAIIIFEGDETYGPSSATITR